MLVLILYIFISSRYVVQPAYEPDAGDFALPEFTSENSYIVKDGDMYVLYYNDVPYLQSHNINQLPDIYTIK